MTKNNDSGPSPLKPNFAPLRGFLSAIAVVMLLLLGFNWTHAYLPGASPILFWSAVAVLVIATLLNAPPVYRYVPKRLKLSSWLSILIAPFVFSAASEDMQAAFSGTPAGEEAARLEAIEADRVADGVAEAARLQGEAADRVAAGLAPDSPQQASPAAQARADRCLSRGRRALADTVKASLQNPRSFEFVDITLATVTGNQAVVFMTFRGENGFGAIRTEAVRAVMDTTDCSITEIGETQSE